MRQTDLIASFRTIGLAYSTYTMCQERDFTHHFLKDHKMSLANLTPNETQLAQTTMASKTQSESAKKIALAPNPTALQ